MVASEFRGRALAQAPDQFIARFGVRYGSSQIRTLVSKWNIEHGVAQAKDVAMATRENRIALNGGLDFVNGRFKEVTVALIDAQGCPRVEQKIRGSFSKPEVEKPSILTSLAGPSRKLRTSQGPLRLALRGVLRRLGGAASLA